MSKSSCLSAAQHSLAMLMLCAQKLNLLTLFPFFIFPFLFSLSLLYLFSFLLSSLSLFFFPPYFLFSFALFSFVFPPPGFLPSCTILLQRPPPSQAIFTQVLIHSHQLKISSFHGSSSARKHRESLQERPWKRRGAAPGTGPEYLQPLPWSPLPLWEPPWGSLPVLLPLLPALRDAGCRGCGPGTGCPEKLNIPLKSHFLRLCHWADRERDVIIIFSCFIQVLLPQSCDCFYSVIVPRLK